MPETSTPSPLEGARTKQREVLQEVSAQAESDSARLLALLRRTEDLTRQIAQTDTHILRQEALHANLRADLGKLTRRKAEIEKETRVLLMERDSTQADLTVAEQAKAKLEAESHQRAQTIKKLVQENDDLQREVDKLEMRRARLEEAVDSLGKARDEYLAKIESLKARQDALAPK